jgi:threonine dehydrogenase-like Zn-dependent dehydrogenase
MRSLVAEDAGRVSWRELAAPQRRHEREALVRPLAVARCDMDLALIFGVTPYPFPIHMGHECVAEVVEGPKGFEPGDRVVVPFQISCGACDRCRRGLTGYCETAGPLSMFGFGPKAGDWGGMLSDLALVPYAEAMLVPLPEGVDPGAVASAADNMPDGWRAVAPGLDAVPGADVLIVGGGGPASIILYAVDAAIALGAGSVTFVDTIPERLKVAESLGARAVEGPAEKSLGRFPVTVDGSASVEGLRATLKLTEWGGHCTCVGTLVKEGELPLWDMYSHGVHLHIGAGMARPLMPEILEMIARGRLRPELIVSSTVAWDEAPEAMTQPGAKLIVTRV